MPTLCSSCNETRGMCKGCSGGAQRVMQLIARGGRNTAQLKSAIAEVMSDTVSAAVAERDSSEPSSDTTN